MAAFKDSTGQLWAVPEFTVGLIRAVKNRTGFDFNKVGDNGEELGKLMFDKFLICDIVAFLTEPARKTANLTEEDFANRCTGQVLSDAWDAIMEAFVDFSRGSKVAAAVTANLRPMKNKAEAQTIAALNKHVGELLASSE